MLSPDTSISNDRFQSGLEINWKKKPGVGWSMCGGEVSYTASGRQALWYIWGPDLIWVPHWVVLHATAPGSAEGPQIWSSLHLSKRQQELTRSDEAPWTSPRLRAEGPLLDTFRHGLGWSSGQSLSKMSLLKCFFPSPQKIIYCNAPGKTSGRLGKQETLLKKAVGYMADQCQVCLDRDIVDLFAPR